MPSNRNRAFLNTLRSRLVLTDSHHLIQAQSVAGPSRSVLDVTAIPNQASHHIPKAMPAPDTLAAIYFTSGSTGEPKGVMRTHADLLRRVQIDRQLLGYHQEDVFSFLYGYSYAGSISDLFGSLLAGGTLQLYDVRHHGLDPLADWLNRQRITFLHINATLMRSFLEQLAPGAAFPYVRLVRPSQRLFTVDVQALWKVLTREAVILHQYAGTETGPICSFKIDRHTVLKSDVVSPGRAVPGVEVMICSDEDTSSDDFGVGEIVVRSPYIASGYWPSSPSDALRQAPYHTGDLGRLHPDGLLELVGRTDSLEKIRGYRVSLAAIELTLLGLDVVKHAIVLTYPSGSEDRVPIAYVVPATAVANLSLLLRRELLTELPDYAVPAQFIILESLPTLANGKVDRQALPRPSTARPHLATPYVAPRTPLETDVAAIWADVLNIGQVGVDDDFLELGGHSLQGARIISRVIETYRVDLPLQVLFDSPTVADMALAITQREAEQLDQNILERLLTELEEARYVGNPRTTS